MDMPASAHEDVVNGDRERVKLAIDDLPCPKRSEGVHTLGGFTLRNSAAFLALPWQTSHIWSGYTQVG